MGIEEPQATNLPQASIAGTRASTASTAATRFEPTATATVWPNCYLSLATSTLLAP